MSITILQRSSQGMRSVKLKNGFLYTAVLLFFVAPLGAAYSGYYYAMAGDKRANVEQTTIDNWKNEIDQQWQQLESAKHVSQTQINALTARLGLIQAHITRLDAASERVLSISGIDAKEFNFGSAPALGGPEKLTGEGFENNYDLNNAFDKVKLSLQSREQQLNVLESLLMDKYMGTERYISGRPTRKGWLSSFYGERSDPFTGLPAWHAGVDFAGSEGDGVFATAAGVVSWVGKRSGYGLLIEINHGDGLVTRYGHNLKALVKKGDVVKKDQVISKMGNSGRSTGAHVHYEVIKNGRPTDPAPYINRKKS
ncbi:MAG: M23 family metallopeptidase [Enterobacterales bacterium]|nr:M23 family metallopeptidase [Enterobacterales bacterium]